MSSGTKPRSRIRNVALTARDLDDFSRLLRNRFPSIRFLPESYWNELSTPRRFKQPPNLTLNYLDSLSDPRTFVKTLWIEPPGWRPLWLGPDEKGKCWIGNEPHLKARIVCTGVSEDPEMLTIDYPGDIGGTFEPGDRERKAFIDAVIRLSEKISTCVVQIRDRGTGETQFEAERFPIWIGYDMVRWLRADERRTISGFLRPVGDA
jgi:hypothetical protein